MAPIDFEKELKDKLRARELEPGEQAWNRIAERLEEDGPGNRTRSSRWLVLVAASIALLMGYFWFVESEKDLILEPGLPSPELVSPSEGTDTTLPEPFDIPETDWAAAPVQMEEAEKAETAEPTSQDPTGYRAVSEKPAVETVLEHGADEHAPGSRNSGLVTEHTEGRNDIREQEVDSLLMRAQESIALQRQTDTISGVDATALLDRAEDELDQTFRDQILEKLKTGYDKVRTAVADRNK